MSILDKSATDIISDSQSMIQKWDIKTPIIIMHPVDVIRLKEEQSGRTDGWGFEELTGDRPEWCGKLVGKIFKDTYVIESSNIESGFVESLAEAGNNIISWNNWESEMKNVQKLEGKIRKLENELAILKETPEEKEARVKREVWLKFRKNMDKELGI